MVWRLFSIPLILAVLLLGMGIIVTSTLSEDEKEHFRLIKQQQIDILSLSVEKVFFRVEQQLSERQSLYESTHNRIQAYLEAEPDRPLGELKQYLFEQLGFEIDLFLVNDDYVVTDTTFPPDLGLDFKAPWFKDAQIAFAEAERTGAIIAGPPTQEMVTRQYKLYTLSKLRQGGYMQLGLIDPAMAELFDNAQAALESTPGILSADLFHESGGIQLQAWTDYSKIRAIRNSNLSKNEMLDLGNKQLEQEYQIFQKVSADNRVEEADPKNPLLTNVYIQLAISALSEAIPTRVLAKVQVETAQPTWIDQYGTSVNGGIILAVAALLVLAFMEIRSRIVTPLLNLKTALESNKEINLEQNRSAPEEIRYLMRTYNDYRANTHELTNKLRHSAITDPLTGLYNRGALDTIHDRLTGVARRNNHLLAMAFIDLDHFKEFNDLYGHQRGDEALIALADSIKDTFRRPTDAGIRFGGEEFLIYFDSDSFAGALGQAELLVTALKGKKIKHEANLPSEILTLSLGLVVVDPNKEDNLETLIKIADEAVYEAKDRGRNQIVSRNLLNN